MHTLPTGYSCPPPPPSQPSSNFSSVLSPPLLWQQPWPARAPTTFVTCTSEQHLLKAYPVLQSLTTHMSSSLAKVTTMPPGTGPGQASLSTSLILIIKQGLQFLYIPRLPPKIEYLLGMRKDHFFFA